MGARDTQETAVDDDCTTTTSFEDHGLADGEALIRRTHYRLLEADAASFEPTPAFFDRLESAFIWSYLATTGETGVPPHVEAAMADARERTRESFDTSPEADLRTDVIPAYYQRVAGFHCLYR